MVILTKTNSSTKPSSKLTTTTEALPTKPASQDTKCTLSSPAKLPNKRSCLTSANKAAISQFASPSTTNSANGDQSFQRTARPLKATLLSVQPTDVTSTSTLAHADQSNHCARAMRTLLTCAHKTDARSTSSPKHAWRRHVVLRQ